MGSHQAWSSPNERCCWCMQNDPTLDHQWWEVQYFANGQGLYIYCQYDMDQRIYYLQFSYNTIVGNNILIIQDTYEYILVSISTRAEVTYIPNLVTINMKCISIAPNIKPLYSQGPHVHCQRYEKHYTPHGLKPQCSSVTYKYCIEDMTTIHTNYNFVKYFLGILFTQALGEKSCMHPQNMFGPLNNYHFLIFLQLTSLSGNNLHQRNLIKLVERECMIKHICLLTTKAYSISLLKYFHMRGIFKC